MSKSKFFAVWDWKSIGSIFVITVLGVCLFFSMNYFPDFVRNNKSRQWSKITEAKYEFSTPIQSLKQSKYRGNYLSTDYIKVTYNYYVDGQFYTSSDKIPNSSQNLSFVNKLQNGELKTFFIKYDNEQPGYSQIIIN